MIVSLMVYRGHPNQSAMSSCIRELQDQNILCNRKTECELVHTAADFRAAAVGLATFPWWPNGHAPALAVGAGSFLLSAKQRIQRRSRIAAASTQIWAVRYVGGILRRVSPSRRSSTLII